MNPNSSANSGLVGARRAAFSRRHFLRGLGACLALPAFESLHPLKLLAGTSAATSGLATTATGAPLRTGFIFFPNGAIPSAWWPGKTGTDFPLSETLQPWEIARDLIQVRYGMVRRHGTVQGERRVVDLLELDPATGPQVPLRQRSARDGLQER